MDENGIATIERQLCTALIECTKDDSSFEQNLIDARNLLFQLDQRLYEIVKSCSIPLEQQSLVEARSKYFIGQLILHVISLLFVQKSNSKTEWKEKMKPIFPLLFFAYNFGPVDTFQADSSLRLSQAANILISCVSNDNFQHWSNENDILNEARLYLNDIEWRKTIFLLIFIAEEHRSAHIW